MCMRCDGYSWDEIDRHTDLMIRVHGYLMLHVGDQAGSWTYTIGTIESWDQPELIVLDVEPELQAVLVHAVADDYVRHGEVRDDTLDMLDVELVPVDESHFTAGMVAAWEERYSMVPQAGDFVQIVPGSSWFCPAHAARVRRLDDAA